MLLYPRARAQCETGSTQFALLGVIVALCLVAFAATAAFSLGGSRPGAPSVRDAPALSLARTAVEAAYIVSGDHEGSYSHVGLLSLRKAGGLPIARGHGAAWLSSASGHGGSFHATVTASSGDTFTVSRATDGSLSHTCSVQMTRATGSGCVGVGSAGTGTW